MFPAWLCSKCIGKKLKWNNESHFLLPSSSSVLQSFESSMEILAWGWQTRQRWVTPVICWLKCSLSITMPSTELVYGAGLGSLCSRVYLLWSFWPCWCSSFWEHDIIIINCFFLTTQKCLAWRSFTDWVWRPRQFDVVQRWFCCWLWLRPWGHWDSKDYFSEPCQDQLGNRFWRL